MEFWLIRKPGFTLLGPYPKPELFEMLREGRFDASVELCPENGNWFYLHDKEQLNQYFPIEAITLGKKDLDSTDVNIETTDIDIHSENKNKALNYFLKKQTFIKFMIFTLILMGLLSLFKYFSRQV